MPCPVVKGRCRNTESPSGDGSYKSPPGEDRRRRRIGPSAFGEQRPLHGEIGHDCRYDAGFRGS